MADSSLLPGTTAEFASKGYWESFFKQYSAEHGGDGASSSFEWYGDWRDVRDMVRSHGCQCTASSLA